VRSPTLENLVPEWPALLAIVIWSSLAAVTGGALATLPASMLLAIGLASASLTFVLLQRREGASWARLLRPRGRDVLLGAYGIAVYHALLFVAFEQAPLIEANLVNDTWPLLAVGLGVFFAGEQGSARLVAGTALAFAGTVLVVAGDGMPFSASGSLVGYACAAGASIVWASFTLALKIRPIDTASLGAAAGLGALGAGIWAFSTHAPLPAPGSFAAAVYLGALPIAGATTLWERGLRAGRVTTVGLLSFLVPPLATLGVVLFLDRPLAPGALVGGLLIVGGAVLGTARLGAAPPEPDPS
jgi:drug/metabolite transporter (DMT)-like permease